MYAWISRFLSDNEKYQDEVISFELAETIHHLSEIMTQTIQTHISDK